MAQQRLNERLEKRESGSTIPTVESFMNLTKPQLFSIYDEDITKSDDNEAYSPGVSSEKGGVEGVSKDGASSSGDKNAVRPGVGHGKRTFAGSILHFIFILAVLSVSGIGYHELSRHLQDNHLLHPEFASRPLVVVSQFSKMISNGLIPSWVNYSLEGVVFGLIIPLIDYVFNNRPRPTSTSSIIRTVNAMLGVTFGIRKIEWSSSLQAAGAWGLLNVILWLIFDGSKSLFWSCAALGGVSCAIGYSKITDISQLLYFMDFHFLGSMLFGKLGRYLLSL